jgi:hypothetical protein
MNWRRLKYLFLVFELSQILPNFIIRWSFELNGAIDMTSTLFVFSLIIFGILTRIPPYSPSGTGTPSPQHSPATCKLTNEGVQFALLTA